MPTRPSSDTTSLVSDSRRVLLAAKKYAKPFRAAEKGRKTKLFPGGFDAFVTALAKSIGTVEKQAGAQVSRGKAQKGATLSEGTARASVFDAVITIRDAVTLTPGIDAAVAQAFGRGMRIAKGSTPHLLNASSAILEAYADASNRKIAAAAGVTPALIKKCSTAREALAAADATQGAQVNARKAGTRDTVALATALSKNVAHVRLVAKSIFRADKAALTAFDSTLPRHTVKKRAAKKSATATGGAPASTTGATS